MCDPPAAPAPRVSVIACVREGDAESLHSRVVLRDTSQDGDVDVLRPPGDAESVAERPPSETLCDIVRTSLEADGDGEAEGVLVVDAWSADIVLD